MVSQRAVVADLDAAAGERIGRVTYWRLVKEADGTRSKRES